MGNRKHRSFVSSFHALLIFQIILKGGAAAVTSAPISVAPSQRWEGNDGPWSTFNLRVGTPAQDVRVLIGLAGQETWVVAPGGCIGSNPSNCQSLRGGTFTLNSSSTWVSTTSIWNNSGIYELGNEIGDLLGIGGAGQYGFDSIGLGWDTATGTTVNRSIVASFIAKEYYLGQLGVSPRPTNFTTANDNSSALNAPQPSFLTLLKEQNSIPSLSWAFNPGSYSRSSTVSNAFGSLTLGGYDASRYSPDRTVQTAFGSDDGRELVVVVNSISATNTIFSSSDTFIAALDSTQPFIWLPTSICRSIETALNITWNSTLEMYLLTEAQHAALQSINPTFTFLISNSTSGANTVPISVPYVALDLAVSSPIVTSLTHYFPLKRAANASQITLGRSFLQEVYLIADYERRNLTVAQALWPSSGLSQTVTIQPLDSANSTNTGNNLAVPPNGLATGAVVGLAVGIVILAIIVTAFALWGLRRQRQRRSGTRFSEKGLDPDRQDSGLTRYELLSKENAYSMATVELDGKIPGRAELGTVDSAKVEMQGDQFPVRELEADQIRAELAGDKQAFELGDSTVVYELPADAQKGGKVEPMEIVQS